MALLLNPTISSNVYLRGKGQTFPLFVIILKVEHSFVNAKILNPFS